MTTLDSSSIKQNLIALFCKVIAFLSFLFILPWFGFDSAGLISNGIYGGITQVGVITSLLGTLTILVICVLIWRGADRISTRLIPEDANNGVIDATFATAVLSLFGIILVVLNIKLCTDALAQDFLLLFRSTTTPDSTFSIVMYSLSAATPIVQMAIGAWLFWQAHKLAPFIERMSAKGIFQQE